MGELTKRAVDAAATATGDTVNPVVTALLATAAVVTRNPELTAFAIPAGAIAGAVTEQGFLLVRDTINDRFDRVRQLVDAVWEEIGQPTEDFVTEYVTDSAKRELLGRVVAAATDARTNWKIRLLAKAFVHGAKDGDAVDETLMFIDLLKPLEPSHARLLALLESKRTVPLDMIRERDPGLGLAAPLLVKNLEEIGLVRSVNSGTGLNLTTIGKAATSWLEKLGEELQQYPEQSST